MKRRKKEKYEDCIPQNIRDAFFDTFFISGVVDEADPDKNWSETREGEAESDEDYLRRGRLLEDLVKKEYADKRVEIQSEPFLDWYANKTSKQKEKIVSVAAKQIFEPLLQELTDASGEIDVTVLEKIKEYLVPEFYEIVDSIRAVTRDNTETALDMRMAKASVSQKITGKREAVLCRIDIKKKRYYGALQSLKQSYALNQMHFVNDGTRFTVADITKILALLAILSVIWKHIQKRKAELLAERDELPFLPFADDVDLTMEECRLKNKLKGKLKPTVKELRYHLASDLTVEELKVIERIAEVNKESGIQVELIPEVEGSLDSLFAKCNDGGYVYSVGHRRDAYITPYVLHNGMCGWYYSFLQAENIMDGLQESYDETNFYRGFLNYDMMRLYLEILAEEYRAKKRTELYARKQSESYAQSYETKANIPVCTVEYMRTSKLNKIYGYVELDELCDLERVETLAREILQFTAEFFPKKDVKKCALRFRRLGKHKASGLYYPQVRCLCIDIRDCTSYIHEFGHLIDHTEGELSLQNEFSAIRFRYEELLQESEDMKKRTGKYDLSYFLEPTEVFARCMEMYFHRIEAVNSDLIGDCTGSEYPEDEILMELVKDYFGKLQKRLLGQEDEREEKGV